MLYFLSDRNSLSPLCYLSDNPHTRENNSAVTESGNPLGQVKSFKKASRKTKKTFVWSFTFNNIFRQYKNETSDWGYSLRDLEKHIVFCILLTWDWLRLTYENFSQKFLKNRLSRIFLLFFYISFSCSPGKRFLFRGLRKTFPPKI